MAEKICRWLNPSNGGRCDRHVHRGQYCIIHLPDKNSEEESDFWKTFKKELASQLTLHPDRLDLAGFVFPYWFYASHILPVKTIDSFLVISQHVDFSWSSLPAFICENLTFQGNVTFDSATFGEVASFRNVTFEGKTSFINAELPGKVVFFDAVFQGPVLFENVRFSDATFHRIKFAKELRLRPAGDIRPEPSLGKSFWTGVPAIVTLRKVRFGGKLELDLLRIAGNRQSTIITFRECVFENLASATLRGSMGCVSLLDVDLSKIEFIDENWDARTDLIEPEKPKRRWAVLEEYALEAVADNRRIKGWQEDVTPNRVAQLCRRLRDKYEANRRYAEAGDFFVGEMEILRKYKSVPRGRWVNNVNVIVRESSKITSPWPFKTYTRASAETATGIRTAKRSRLDPFRLFLLEPYRILALYGESISRPAIASVLVIFLFTLFRLFSADGSAPTPVSTAFEESIFSFFQLTSNNSLDFIERLLSAPILGLFFIALRRKLERR
jgi:uncharacterized protein YjbI with pentapeptide repeats